MNQVQQMHVIQVIKNSIALLKDETGTKLKETILNDLSLLEPHLMEAPKSFMQIALEERLALQAHYASILNSYDDGNRQIFKSVSQWLNRLKETGPFNHLSEPTPDQKRGT